MLGQVRVHRSCTGQTYRQSQLWEVWQAQLSSAARVVWYMSWFRSSRRTSCRLWVTSGLVL